MAQIPIVRLCTITLATLCVTFADASAQSRGRTTSPSVPLGCYPIKLRGPDVGTIRVDLPGNQRFRGVQLRTTAATVRMLEMNVRSPTDQPDVIPVEGLRVTSSERTQELFLRGNGHEVREIELKFDTTIFDPRRSALCVDGIPSGATPRNWVEIGCHTVDFSRNEFDPIRVTNPTALIERLRVVVRDNDVQIDKFTVRYSRTGRTDELGSQVRPRLIKADRRSRSIRLSAGPQQIFQINLTYIPPPNVQGTAVACVEGLEIPATPIPQKPDPAQAGPPPAGWERLGCEVVWRAGGGGTFQINNDRDRFTAIQAQAFLGSLRVNKLEIVPIRGRTTRIDPFFVRRDAAVARFFNEGPLNIGTIEISSAADSDAGAVICLNGQKMADAPTEPNPIPDPTTSTGPGPGWRLIGCQLAQTKPEYDVYQVGKTEGPYRAIMLQSRKGRVKLYGVKIIFENNDEESWSAGQNQELVIEDGKYTPPLALAGGSRLVRRILMLYQSGSDFREAEVCIHGQFDLSRPDFPGGGFWMMRPISDQPWDRRR